MDNREGCTKPRKGEPQRKQGQPLINTTANGMLCEAANVKACKLAFIPSSGSACAVAHRAAPG